MRSQYVSQRPIGRRDSCGIGNVIIPKNIDPIQYVTTCFRTGKLSIVLENGGIIDNVLIAKHAMNDLDFPSDYKSLGSQVVWINKPRQNIPIIIAILTKKNEVINVGRYKSILSKRSANSIAEVTVDSQKGIIIVNSNSSIDSQGDIYIISTNKNQSSKLKVLVSGNVDIQTPLLTIENSDTLSFTIQDPTVDNNVTTFSYIKGTGWSYKDEFGNEYYLNSSNIQFKPTSKFNIGDGNHPIPLGDTLQTNLNAEKDALSALFQAIENAPITPGDGGATFKAGLITAIQAIIRGDYSQILSAVSNTD